MRAGSSRVKSRAWARMRATERAASKASSLAPARSWIARVSRDLLGLDPAFVALHDELLGGLGLPLSYDAPFADLRPIMSLDKKARGTTLRLVGLTGQGAPRILDDAPEDVLASAYAELTR